MADTTFKIKRGLSGGASPSGLTHGELAVNTTDNRLFVGSITGSVNALTNRFYTGAATPNYPIDGDRWYDGSTEKFYYGGWVVVSGVGGAANIPLASATVTGVASFGNEFTVSGLGAVSLTSNYVISVNGRTGNVGIPLASSSSTGVASFTNDFVVSNLGSVSLTANYVKSVNGITGAVLSIATTGSNTFLGLQTFNAGATSNHLYVSQGATFANGLFIQSGRSVVGGNLSMTGGSSIFLDNAASFPLDNPQIVGIATKNVLSATGGFLSASTWPASGLSGAFILGTRQSNGGPTGFGVLYLMGVTGNTSQMAAAAVIATWSGKDQMFATNGLGQVRSFGTWTTSDRSAKTDITTYTESSQPVRKWIYAVRNDFNPYSFKYVSAPGIGTRYGYMANDLQKVDDKLVSEFLNEATGATTYYVSTDQLLFGAIEAVRELDAEVCRLWKTSSTPPPSRAKDNDLWFDPTTSKMYMRFNDGTQSQWIQVT